MKRTTIECPHCHKLISKSNFNRHINSHQTHPEYQESLKTRQAIDHDGLNCKYCGKLCKNKNSLAQHECRCSINPNKIKINLNSQGNHKSHPAWNKGLTKETDARVAKIGQVYSERARAGRYSWEHNKHSEATKEKIRQQKLELCATQGTNLCGKGKRGYYKGYYCQSSWELAYVVYQLEHGINFIRNKQGFSYLLNNIKRSYFPDFYLIDDDIYVEIKGYYDNKTKEKEKQFPTDKKLKILKQAEMQPILDYVITKYGKNYIYLYEE